MAKLIRRFEPRYGVSRPMIEDEAKHLAREAESYLRLSLDDLRQKLSERGAAWNQADEALHALMTDLPEREQLGIKCLLVRDLHHILELYIEHVRSTRGEVPIPIRPPADLPRQPFSEWLFGK
jgi:hypothetical protein